MRQKPIPPMPEGFTDRAAWDAIHFEFSDRWSRTGSMTAMEGAVMSWQLMNQERVIAAIAAQSAQLALFMESSGVSTS